MAAVAAVTAATSVAPAVASEQERHQVLNSGLASLLNATARPGAAPGGANDWSCVPAPEHPEPVVLVHGTVENMTYNGYSLAPRLANEGYCVFAFNYGQGTGLGVGLPGAYPTGGTAPIAASAEQLSGFVDSVLAATGADEVDLVGHSQGGMMPRQYLKFLGGAEKVDKLVGLSPSNHGTDVDGLALLPGVPQLLQSGLGDSVRDQMHDSEFLAELNAGGETVPGVDYTVIQTRYDEIVTPHTSAFLDGPNVNNILLQDGCEVNATDHLGISFDRRAEQFVVNALDPEHAAEPPCEPSPPINGATKDAMAADHR
ncbi:esterase/lipase family protein [Saccharopolyspora montiporae]|uniref:esterase/lipase family protein n=1 Tax=Saccharopolyspora montiporae TaxID=2781240 RepID=UPI00351CB3BB